jgi:hypothetical protein
VNPIKRRDLLKTAAVAGAAVATAPLLSRGVLAAPAPAAFNSTKGSSSGLSWTKGRPSASALVPQNQEVLRIVSGEEFHTIDPTQPWTYNTFGSIFQSGGASPGFFGKRVDLSPGALLTELEFGVVKNDANTANVELWQYNGLGGGTLLGQTDITTTSASVQIVSIVPSSPITMDVNDYQVYWHPGSVGPTHQLWAMAVLSVDNNGVVLFPNPRRVYGTGALVGPGQSQTVDATTIIPAAGGGASGVPVGAIAAYCAISSYGTGAISLYPQGSPNNGIGAWASQGTAGNGVNQSYNFVPLNPNNGQFTFTNYFTTKAMYFDVWGYLV